MSTPLWLHNLAAYSLQIALLVSAGGLLPYALGLRIPKVRLAYWHLLLALCLLLPVMEPWQHTAAFANAEVSVSSVTVAALTAPSRPLPSLPDVLLFVLAAGILARVAWLATGFWRLSRYRRRALPLLPVPAVLEELQSRIGVGAEICLCAQIPSPVTFGFRRPVVLLPASFAGLDPSVQQAIGAHELLHVRRRDWLFTVMEEGIRTALWFHPAIWWLLGQVQLAREQVVDREVVRLTRSREQYLEALLAVAAGHVAPDLAPAPLFLRKRHLARRVASILKEVSMSKRRLIASLCAAAGLVFLVSQLAVRAFPLQAPAADEQGITVETGGASLLHRTAVEYPPEALEKRIQGPMVLELSLNEKGLVSDARVLSGPEELRRAALQSALQWHFSSEMPLPGKTQVTINFELPQKTAAETAPPRSRLVLSRGGPSGAGAAGPAPVPSTIAPFGVLKQIQIEGLSPVARETLLSRLPVHVGDTLSNEAIARVQQVVRETDQHLVTGVRPAPDGSATLRIFIPNRAEYLARRNFASPSPASETASPQRVRVGSDVQRSNLVQAPRPAYPPLAKQARVQGTVELEAVIGKDGTVQNLTVLSGHPLLVPAALDAVKQWVYRPTLLNGNPVEVITQIDVHFTLLGEPPPPPEEP